MKVPLGKKEKYTIKVKRASLRPTLRASTPATWNQALPLTGWWQPLNRKVPPHSHTCYKNDSCQHTLRKDITGIHLKSRPLTKHNGYVQYSQVGWTEQVNSAGSSTEGKREEGPRWGAGQGGRGLPEGGWDTYLLASHLPLSSPWPGLSTSFPIDGTFFNSWLAQSVQITA